MMTYYRRSYNETACGDGFLGPGVWTDGCRGGFDFTLAFEDSILSILPAALFLLLSIPRSVYLLRSPDKAKRRATYTPKLIVASAFAGIQVGCLALVASSRSLNAPLSIAAAVLNLVAASCIVLVSHIEHVKSIRPSFLLSSYLFTSLLFDAAKLRTQWLISIYVSYAAVLSTSTALKIALLVLENVEKRKILVDSDNEPSKESTSGPFNRGFFVWLNSLLISGWATILTNPGLPTIYEKLSSEKLAVLFVNQWDKATRDGRKASLVLNTMWILKLEIVGIFLPRLATVGLTIAQPFLVSKTLRFLALAKDENSDNIGYGLIGAFAFVFVGSAILTAWYEHLTFRAGAMIRGGLIGLIYRKMVRLPTKELNESSAVTLMGNDIEMLAEKANALIIESWANGLTVAIAIWMLNAQLGLVCVAPVIMAIISLVLCGFIGKSLVDRQTTYQKATQDRINFTSEVLGSIKAVKMLGYSETFSELIEQKRDNDLANGKQYRWMIVWNNAVGNGVKSMTQAVTFGAYAIAAKLSGNQSFSAQQAITALSILNVMMDPLSLLMSNIPSLYSAIGCFRRIQEFLALPERVDTRIIEARPGKTSNSTLKEEKTYPVTKAIELSDLDDQQEQTAQISISDANFSWGETKVLGGINASFPRAETGSLTMIIGPIGSGKSSLLKAILGETTSAQGNVVLSTPSIAFCDQTSWVMNASIKDNIVAESGVFDEEWFHVVVEACDLIQDFARLPAGTATIVGDKGIKLSGGQKQRLAIARAVYSRKPVAMFDDVFSGLDKATERAVFRRVFGKNGLLRHNATTVILATHSVHLLPESDNVIALGRDGQILEQGPFAKLRSAGKYVQSLDITEPETDDESEELPSPQRVPEEAEKIMSRTDTIDEKDEPPSDRSTFKYYFSAMSWLGLSIGGSYIIGQAFLATFLSVWLIWWGDGRGRSSSDVGYWLGIFTFLAAAFAVFVTLAIMHFLLIIGPASGKKLHTRILTAVMRAPMNVLSNIETGSLVNRFSQDMRLVDIDLPVNFVVFLFDISLCFGVAGLAIGAVGYFAATIPFVAVVLVMIQRFYVRTSKQLRILEIEHKAPLYSHFLESIQGLATIRAFGWVQPYTTKNLALLNHAQKPSYLLNCVQRWLTLVLDLVVAVLTVVLVLLAVALKGKLNPSLLGIALVNMMNLGTNLKGIVIAWSQLETSLGAVMRIKSFEETTPSEILPEENRVPGIEWPSQGTLEFRGISVQYDTTTDPVLRNVSLDTKHGEKIGLVGRSGSGKSSLIQALLRMANISSGEIILDGEDITKIPKSLVRQKLSCLTQDPFLFSNTVRFNADPLSENTDEDIISAMKRAGVWEIIKAKVGENSTTPLDEKMDENFLSHGQRQLFCLGRALLKESRILILDEPTSNIDNQTDAQIQKVIRSEFKDRTVIMIAHRLDTLLDFDKIAVLDNGTLAEVGAPSELLQNVDGLFAKLYYGPDKTKRRSLDTRPE